MHPAFAAASAGRALPMALLLVAAAALGLGAYHLTPLTRARAEQTLAVASCDPGRQHCRVALPDGGELEFAIGPRPLRALASLRIDAALAAAPASAIEVSFTGSEMDMGETRAHLAAADSGRFSGQVVLPICASGAMQWLATVVVTQAGRRTAVPFRFTVGGR